MKKGQAAIAISIALIASNFMGYNVGLKSGADSGFKKGYDYGYNIGYDIKDTLLTNEKKNLAAYKNCLALNDVTMKQMVNSKFNENTFEVLEVNVTAYSPMDDVNGINSDVNNLDKDGNPRTSLGVVPALGTIAVDPNVIPYYSEIIVVYADGTTETGVALDCGGAIKGNRLDVFRTTYNQAISFGKKKATVLFKRPTD